jgi:hypothetical protein
MVTPNYDYVKYGNPSDSDYTVSGAVKNPSWPFSSPEWIPVNYTGRIGVHTLETQYLNTASVRTPGYRRLKKYQLQLNPYFKAKIVRLYPASSMFCYDRRYNGDNSLREYYDQSFSINFSNFDGSYGATNIEDLNGNEVEVVNATSRKVLNELNTAKANTAVSIAEAHKTAAMVASAATRIYNTIRCLRRADLVGATKALGVKVSVRQEKQLVRKEKSFLRNGNVSKSTPDSSGIYNKYDKKTVYKNDADLKGFVAKSYLERQYGWMPLLQDVRQHAEALAEFLVDHSNELRLIKKGSSGAYNVTDVNRTKYGETWELTRKLRINTFCSMSIWYKIPDGRVNPLNTFGLTNPLVVAWELVPFSFVADWFLPIGDALAGLTATDGLQFSRGTRTTRTVRYVQSTIRQYTPYKAGDLIRTWTGSASGSQLEVYQQRILLNDFPQAQLPTWKDPRSFSHAASSIALLTSLFLGKK